MTDRKLMLTLLHPLPTDVSMSKNSLAKKLSKSSSVFESGVIFKGAENSGGNALGALYPIIHLTPHTTESKRLVNTINTSSHLISSKYLSARLGETINMKTGLAVWWQ